jgi:hypothetical protein
LHSWLCNNDFVQSKVDNCLYILLSKDCSLVVLIWVDDILYFSQSISLLSSFKSLFAETFSIDDNGEMLWFLGTAVSQSKGEISLNQKSYVADILRRASMTDCHSVSLPAVAHTRQSKVDCPKEGSPEFDNLQSIRVQYRSIVGNLLYLSVVSRPDICFAVANLSQFVSNPGLPHWKALKHLLRYLKGSPDLSLVYRRCDSSQFALFVFADSDWANDSDDRRSTSGHCFKLSTNSAVVSWSCRKQPTVALSSCEAEYIAMASAAQESMFLRGLMNVLDADPAGSPLILYGDNQGAIAQAANPIGHKRSKHIDIRHHYLRELVEKKTIQLAYVPTAQNVADILTKNLPKDSFSHFQDKLFGVSH